MITNSTSLNRSSKSLFIIRSRHLSCLNVTVNIGKRNISYASHLLSNLLLKKHSPVVGAKTIDSCRVYSSSCKRNNEKVEIEERGIHFETIVEMQIKTCKLHSNKNALGTFKDGKYHWMTYEELGKAINAFRSVLSTKYNITYGDKVALISNNRVEWAVSFYAVNSLGAQVVPM